MTVGIKFSRGLRLCLLAALLLQAMVVQTHVHFARISAPEFSSAGMTGGPQTKPAPQASNSDFCPLCWEMAMAGHYFVPPALVVPPMPPVLLWVAMPLAAAFALARQGHGWLSRAPPQ